MSSSLALYITTHPWILVAAAIWTLPWKGVALWKAAQRQSLIWFILLLVINDLGILEIIYIFLIERKKYLPKKQEEIESDIIENKIFDIRR